MPLKTEAIKLFLLEKTHKDLASLYNSNMECQVNVSQDNGVRIEGDYKGKKWHGWTDYLTTWKPFRIPFNAGTNPEYNDTEIGFNLEEHVESIGMTGWDWLNKCSKWVAFDFDSIISHSKGLTNSELNDIKDSVKNIDWVTVRCSTSGSGIHLYIFLNNPSTLTHHEHAALARAILGKLGAITGYNFQTKVDNCGGNMWVWHKKMIGTNGLKVLKFGGVLDEIPANWKDHVNVVRGKRTKNLPTIFESRDQEFENLVNQRLITDLDKNHLKLVQFLQESDVTWWWDQDHFMLVTHTAYLKDAYDSLDFKGFFETNAQGKERNTDYNCFLFPLKNGSWVVRRYTLGIQEHESWDQDGQGWTRCYFNREPSFAIACRAIGGVENQKGGFVFREAENAIKAGQILGVNVEISGSLMGRRAILKQHKDGRLIVEVDREDYDTPVDMPGWLADKKQPWTKIFNMSNVSHENPEIGIYDDTIRHLITEINEDCGWVIKSEDHWQIEPISHIKVALTSLGITNKDISKILGSSVFKPWKLVNKPFEPEYPGNREWNQNATQLRYTPNMDKENLSFSHWSKILHHCGFSLNNAVQNDPWAIKNGIITGSDYLKCWIASLFQNPKEPLPYLFLYGPQNSGKSILHEALSLLLTTGHRRADIALVSQAGFNAELEGTILCIVEEVDLRKNKVAYNRIKDWVTSRELLIHAKNKTPYHTLNTTHWIQCSNDFQSCPIFSGDTRITMIHVPLLEEKELIPKKELIQRLEKEAPDFLAEILKLEIPESQDRLGVPVIETADKNFAQNLNKTDLDMFMDENCKKIPGQLIKFSEFFDKFLEWLDPNEIFQWSKNKVGREVPPEYPKARLKKDGQIYIGNIDWADSDKNPESKFIVVRGFLEKE